MAAAEWAAAAARWGPIQLNGYENSSQKWHWGASMEDRWASESTRQSFDKSLAFRNEWREARSRTLSSIDAALRSVHVHSGKKSRAKLCHYTSSSKSACRSFELTDHWRNRLFQASPVSHDALAQSWPDRKWTLMARKNTTAFARSAKNGIRLMNGTASWGSHNSGIHRCFKRTRAQAWSAS